MCYKDVIDEDENKKGDSQNRRTNQSIIWFDIDVIDEDKETESGFHPTTTLTFLTICECPTSGRVVYKQWIEIHKLFQNY